VNNVRLKLKINILQSLQLWLRPIGHALSDQLKETPLNRLTWTHIRQILRVPYKEAQLWYLQEAAQQNWLLQTLDRHIARILSPMTQFLKRTNFIKYPTTF
jgi:hypothetical protein